MIDDSTSRTYWYNEVTGESRWEMPMLPTPTVPSALAAALAADPPLSLRDVSSGASFGDGQLVPIGGGLDGMAIDSLLNDMLQVRV